MESAGCTVEAWPETFPIAGQFRISRNAKTEAVVVVCRVAANGASGIGECVPYNRYGETVDSVLAQIEAAKSALDGTISRQRLAEILEPGAARNAFDCALWDLEAKLTGKPVAGIVCAGEPHTLVTAYTLSLDTPTAMGEAARKAAHRPLLKIKLGSTDDVAAMRAVASGAPQSRIIVDANEGWSPEALPAMMEEAARLGIALIEQPLPAGRDALLSDIPHPVPICADESVHTSENLAELRGRYDAVNIKLDKTGGLTEALGMRDRARELGFAIMVGCMVGTSLGMAPAILLAQDAEFVDLDGPLLLARDRTPALHYEGSTVSPPLPELWG